jgi:PhzF family phenazine biosynthesis protein
VINELVRLAAFTKDPSTGNPAGVWLGAEFPAEAEMQRIAAKVGYSETAFVTPLHGLRRKVRYFSPEAEVDFCGHATIAAGVQLGRIDGVGLYAFDTNAGIVTVRVSAHEGEWRASLTSVAPVYAAVSRDDIHEVLHLLGWSESHLDTSIPAARIFAGLWHLLIAVRERATLAQLVYDFESTKSWMKQRNLTTLQLMHRESDQLFHSRNPFPVGGVYEDPATGAAAAALGGYLRDAGLIAAPATFVVRQGEDMGRLSILEVEVPSTGGIVVSGTAVEIRST